MNELDFEEMQQIVSVCLDEIVNLKEENKQLRTSIDSVYQAFLSSLKSQEMYMQKSSAEIEKALKEITSTRASIKNIKYELYDSRTRTDLTYYPEFYSYDETIQMLIEKKASMARFGDGEFAIMCNKERQKFQRLDPKLSDRLSEIIHVNEESFLIGIADNYGDLSKYNDIAKLGIRLYMTDEIRKEHLKFINPKRKYHDAYISRPYVIYEDNKTSAPRQRFDALKSIWNERDIIFIEGSQTRLGVGNDLFDNAHSIKRIIAPPTNSFDKYDEIMTAALEYGNKDSLFLIALGPSAGVIAYDLFCNGMQAIDIGHVDLEYEYYKQGKGIRVEVKNKYNNEFPGGDVVEDICDEKYESEILTKII